MSLNGQRYILTVQNSDIFKEADVSADMPVIKVGTLQDCDVRLKRELFRQSVCVTLRLESNEWRISCGDGLSISSRAVTDCGETAIKHGDVLSVHDVESKDELFSLSFSYDFTVSATDFDTIIDIRNIDRIIIGNSSDAQLKLTSGFIGMEYIVLTRKHDGLAIDAANAQNSATINGIRIFNTAVAKEFDFIGIADYSFYFKNQVLYTTMRDDLRISGISAQPLADETPAFTYPKLNRGPRMLYAFNTDEIEILNPPKKPDKPRDNLVLQLTPALAMMAVTVIIRSGLIGGLNMGNPAFMIFSIATMTVGILTSALSFVHNRRRYKKDLAEWEADYKKYIANKRQEIEAEQKEEHAALIDIYPETERIRDFVKTFSGRLFERSPKDVDFLHVRAGLGAVPALREPTYRQEEHIKVENDLMPIPGQLCAEYALIKDMPVMIHLRESGSIGVIGAADEQYEFFKNILLDMSVQHDYEDVQIVVLLPQRNEAETYENWLEKYEYIKWLPHIKESGGGVRGIICNDESRDTVFEHLYSIMTAREKELSENDKIMPLPYVVVFVLDEYGIKTHPLFKYAEDSARLGFSFIYFKEYIENLPQYCMEIIELKPNGGVLRLKNNKAFERPFARERIKDDSIKLVAERLAPVFSEKIALSSRLTSNISLFELLNIISPDDLNLIDRWKKSNVQKSLAAPLGVDAKGAQVILDLHERAHGPHGLVAGTTGSGKSEIMQSYILSAAVNFHPYEVAFVMIDFKGGGMANQFDGLPHLIGKITDIDSHEINRSLLSIRAEIEKRKKLFAEYGVNHIDQYIAKFKAGVTNNPLPHLILIVDEFAELRAEQPEFMKELISTARVGRSLGIHLILATQKPDGQVNEQILSNLRFRLCLKVATKEDSAAVLKSPLAAEILEPGRAYLQVGSNEIFTLFQSAYSGASAISDKNGNIREFIISEVSFTGKRAIVYEKSYAIKLKRIEQIIANIDNTMNLAELKSIIGEIETTLDDSELLEFNEIADSLESKWESEMSERLKKLINEIINSDKNTQLKAIVEYINDYCEKFGIEKLPSICQPPLPETLAYVSEPESSASGTIVCVGVYDDPSSQRQPDVRLSLSDGNVMIIGSAQTGKTMLLQTMLRGIAEKYSPKQVSVYILDFASKVMKVYEKLNHVGGVLTDADDDKLKNFFKLIREELSDRKERFSRFGVSSYEAYCEIDEAGKVDLPHIIVMLDNISAFKETYPDYEEALLHICREGLALGITVIATSKQTTGLSYKYMSNFGTRLAFNCTENSEYNSVFDRCLIRPKNLQGRGLVAVEKVVYEYQAYLPFDGETESRRNEQAKAFITDIEKKYGSERARAVPSIPSVLTEDYWNNNKEKFSKYIVPVGLTYSEIEPVTIDLARVGTVGIYGREGFGKSNLLRVILSRLQRNVFDWPCEAYIVDSYDRQLAEFQSCGFIERFTVDCSEFEDIVQKFSDAVKARMEILSIGGNLDNEPLLLCVVQNPQIFAVGTVAKSVSDQFKKLINEAKHLKICFIFSNVDNNADYSASEVMKTARDFAQYFLLDDIANVKLFGTGKFNANDLKQYKKPISVGDGYSYDSRNGIDKIKLTKCERGV